MNHTNPLTPQETPRIKREIRFKPSVLLPIVTVLIALLLIIQIIKSVQMLDLNYYQYWYQGDVIHHFLPVILLFLFLLFVLMVNALFTHVSQLTEEVQFLKQKLSGVLEKEDHK